VSADGGGARYLFRARVEDGKRGGARRGLRGIELRQRQRVDALPVLLESSRSGVELDAGIEARVAFDTGIRMSSGAHGGVLFPGGALEDASGARLTCAVDRDRARG
jgi:hypothetical protein